jgi:hypothetical protein
MVLHMAPTLPPAEDPEVLMLEAGGACDVTGARNREVSGRAIEELLAPSSRADFKREFPGPLRSEAAASRLATRRCSCTSSRNASPTPAGMRCRATGTPGSAICSSSGSNRGATARFAAYRTRRNRTSIDNLPALPMVPGDRQAGSDVGLDGGRWAVADRATNA